MDSKRFAGVVLLFAGGIVLLTLYVMKSRAQRDASSEQPSAATTAAATSEEQLTPPATQPAGTAPSRAAQSGPKAEKAATSRHEWLFKGPREAEKYTIGSLIAEGPYFLQVELTSRGGAIHTLKLAKHFMTVEDKQLFDKDPSAYAQKRQMDPSKYQGHYSLLNPVAFGDESYLPFATRKIRLYLPDREQPVEIRLDNKPWDLAASGVDAPADVSQSIRLSWTLYRDRNFSDAGKPSDPQPFLKLTKTYTVFKDSYSLTASLELENLSSMPVKLEVDQAGPTGVPRDDIRRDNRRAAYAKLMAEDQTVQPISKPGGELSKMPLGKPVTVGLSDETDSQLWLGHVNKFFGSVMYLIPPAGAKKSLAAGEYKASFYVVAVEESATSRTFLTGAVLREMQIEPGQAKQVSFDVFAGPKLRSLFYDNKLYEKLKYVSMIDFGGCFCAWQELTLGMMWLLQKLALVAMGNYGVAIIMLVICVRMALHPLTKKGQVSMSKMQKLAPQMQKLKEKYADDKSALNREMMQLYKQAGASPLLGFLPMLLQMPIWIALWTALNATVELRHSALIPVWITDLAAPDALFTWSAALPFIGTRFNLLPILLTVAMFLQTKLSPQMGQVSPDQEKQQALMKVMMPVMMLAIFYNAPSGLTLYIMASTFAGVAEQYVIRKHILQKQQEDAERETLVRVPGKGPRGSRPKKSRGPFWIKGK